ncbi:PAS domain-containing sensor histidine kinase [Cyclobacterium qasimii]|nr:ATP-binding protein [Cyclobacterium qasimii]EPR71319.1 PAS/PAC sensor signal transduction histidine kinase [Cyclobacterium qasimii M12-11B]
MEEVYWTFSYSVLIGDKEETEGILITCIETTDAVLNLKKLQESESQLAFAIDAAELGTWDYNPAIDSFQGNDRLMDWLGIPKGTAVSMKNAFEAIVPEDKARVMNNIQKTFIGHKASKFSDTFSIKNHKTDEIKIVRALGRSRFKNDKVFYRFNGTLQDVSEQVRYEQKLKLANAQIKKEEQRFRDIVFKAPVGIAIFKGKNLVSEMANNMMLKFVDREANNFVGKKLFEAMPEVRNTVSHFFEEVFNKQEAVRGTEVKINIKRNGGIIDAFFNFIIQPITFSKGEVTEIMLVTNEVTDYVKSKYVLAENESQFRNHMLHSPIAMTILRGKDLKIEMANKRMLNHFWARSWEEVDGKNLAEVFPELIGQKYLGELQQVLTTGQAIKDKASKVIVTIDGREQEFYMDYHYLPLPDVDYSISGVIVTTTDVTDMVLSRNRLENFTKELESQVDLRTEQLLDANEKLQDSIAKLENANEGLQSFAYVSSHDLQEPLRKIQMYTSVLMENEQGRFSERGKKYFEKITNAAGRMRTLIDDLLAFSKSNDDITKYEEIDLNVILEQVLEDSSNSIEHSNAKIMVKELPKIEAIVFQMHQVFTNLISNAIKFAKQGVSPEIIISASEVSAVQVQSLKLNPSKKYFALSITDNGIGLPKGMEGKIFEVFQRLHGRQEYEGTGIGLAIVKKIISNHGGAIKAESVEGKGTIFTIFLPEKRA